MRPKYFSTQKPHFNHLTNVCSSVSGRMHLVYYEILILQDNQNLKADLWKPVTKKEKMPREQNLYGVKKRYFRAPEEDDPKKEFLRYFSFRMVVVVVLVFVPKIIIIVVDVAVVVIIVVL